MLLDMMILLSAHPRSSPLSARDGRKDAGRSEHFLRKDIKAFMKKKLLYFLLPVLGAALLAGCGKKAEKEEAAPAADSGAEAVVQTGIKVGVSLPDESDAHWKMDGDLFYNMLRQEGYEPVVTYAAGEAEQQAASLGSMIESGCQLLIVAPVDGAALTSQIAHAKERGVKVIALDSLITGTDGISAYVGFDDYGAGQMQAQFVLDSLGIKESGTSKAYTLEFAAGDLADPRQGFYYNGAYDALLPYIDGGVFRILSGQAAFADAGVSLVVPEEEAQKKAPTVEGEAKSRFSGILSSFYPEATQLDAVLSTCDEASRGVLSAIRSSYGGKNKVIVTGSGALDDSLDAVLDGSQSMTVFYPFLRLPEVACRLADSYLKGESPDESLIGKSAFVFGCRYDTESYDNGTGILPAYLVMPEVLTASNYESVLIDSGYYEMSGKSLKRKEIS